jgi:hypothetical protein
MPAQHHQRRLHQAEQCGLALSVVVRAYKPRVYTTALTLCDAADHAWLLLHRIKDFMPPNNAISRSGGEVVPTINVDGTQQIDAFNERGGCPYAGAFQETLDHDISTHVNFPASMSGSPLSE